ncbi:MAG: sugar phosphate isomerase/epimerase [Clostridia bacterium]|nr:sugar phosphate isomerase/epimerase [Clostridia bacterium]
MKFGIAVPVDKASILKKLGYDYFEPSFGALGKMTDDDYKVFCDDVAKCGLIPEAMNMMLIGGLKVVGEEVDLSKVKDFLELTFARAANVGTKTVVFGSGGARNVPVGFERAKAYDQIEDFLKMAGPIAEKNGCTIAIEPLNYASCNIINTVGEAAFVAARVDHPAVRILGDYFHMGDNKEDCEGIYAFAHRLEHMHIGRHVTRLYPFIGDGCDYTPFMGNLKKAGYNKRVSIEGSFNDFEADSAKALELLKSLD